ncbi:MAG: N-acetylmuramoyl-L-alanine amidase family protein [Negativicutes bacterium]|jgi:N-acetylmuramoyl-L-alanine amidase
MPILYITKRMLVIFLVVGFVLTSILACSAMNRSPLEGRIIIVDAGHGGIDPGANRPGVEEKNINLAIALELKTALNSYGAKVILSRDCDTDLSGLCDNTKIKGRYHRDLAARVELVEESDADLFISIHANSNSNSKKIGAESFYAPRSESSKLLANSIQNELYNVIPSPKTANPGNYFVLKRNKVPAALVEVGYITNPLI